MRAREKTNSRKSKEMGRWDTKERRNVPRIQLFCHSDKGMTVVGFDVDDCDEVREGASRHHRSLTSDASASEVADPFLRSRRHVIKPHSHYLLQNHSVL